MKDLTRYRLIVLLAVAICVGFGMILGSTTENAWAAPSVARTVLLDPNDPSDPTDPEGLSTLGDFIWYDQNLNGLPDPGEPGIDNVLVQVYLDDGDGIFELDGSDSLFAATSTGDDPSTAVVEHGWYEFDVDFGPGRLHWVHIPASNFEPGNPLAGFTLTSATTLFPNPALVIELQIIAERNEFDFGFAHIDIELKKTVYLGHNNGASCTGVESVQGLNGTAITYCFEVTNVGTDAWLDAITIDDPDLGITQVDMTLISNTQPLTTGESLVYYYETTIITDLLNTATAAGNPTDENGVDLPGIPDPTDGDTATVDEVTPDLTLEKSVYLGHDNGVSCTGNEEVAGVSGAAVTYCFEVINTGDTRLDTIAISDPNLGITNANMTLRNGSLPLAVGASLVYYYESSINGDLLNSATASGRPIDENGDPLPGATPPSDTDTATVNEVAPALDLQKSVYLGQDNGASCMGGESVVGTNGAAVTYCFEVTNMGDTWLDAVTISDPALNITEADMILLTGSLPLTTSTSLIYYYETTIDGDLQNIATTSATPTDENGNPLSGIDEPTDVDTASVDEVTPAVEFQKTIYLGHDSGISCTGSDSIVGINGEAVTYCFEVTNIGDTWLDAIAISDPDLGITDADMTLLSGSLPLTTSARLLYYYETTINGDLINTAAISTTPTDESGNPLPGLVDLTDEDSASVDEVAPAIELQKTVYLGHDSGVSCVGADKVAGDAGTEITYCFEVTNTGDTYIDDIAITDPAIGITQADMILVSGATPLAPDDSQIYAYETAINGDLVNTATTSGNPTDPTGTDLPGIENPTHEDSATVDEVQPALTLQKTVYLGHDNGESCSGTESIIGANGSAITYCFEVTNTGDTWLNDIAISDPALEITQDDMTLLSGSLPLTTSASLVYYYETTLNGDLQNTALASGNPADEHDDDLPGLEDPTDSDTASVDGQGPAIRLDKTVYAGHDDGASCVGVDTITAPNQSAITYCFEVINVGDSYLDTIIIDDPHLNITHVDMTQLSGTTPLAPGDTLLYYYETTINGALENTASTTGNPTDESGNDIPDAIDPVDENTATVILKLGSISGTVWHDLDGDGILDDDEPPIPGVTITLSNGNIAITDQNGDYSFEDLPDGIYAVFEADLPNYISTNDTDGGTNNLISNLVILNGNDIVDQDFLDTIPLGSISGTVYEDLNDNGQLDPGEPGIPGVTITLSNGMTDTTDSNGGYTFTGLPPGDYTITETNLPEYISTGDVDGANDDFITVTLDPGEEIINQDFFDVQLGSISGTVWEDINNNGQQDENEPGIPGVIITLSNGMTTTTDTNGDYIFPNVTPGNYTVTETDPTDFTSTTPNRQIVGVDSGEDVTDVDFGDQQDMPALGSISGTIWEDTNGNGEQDDGEQGIPNVVVMLNDGSVTVTDADGNYLFDNLPDGIYSVTTTDPANYTSTNDADGGTDNLISNLTIENGNDLVDQDFFDTPQSGSIGGTIYEDLNENGQFDPGEPGLPGVIVTLSNGTTTTTDENGDYLFTDLPPGEYTIIKTNPDGYTPTGDIDGPNDDMISVSLLPGEEITDQDFFCSPLPGSISGTVFNDLNSNGVQDPNEPGLPGVIVTLSNGNTVTTDSNGDYLFTGLPPGDYTITEISPSGYVSTGDTDGGDPDSIFVTLTPGLVSTGQDFGNVQTSTISGGVYEDTNNNGIRDPDEVGVSGVIVSLSNGMTTTTDNGGSYLFTVLPGTYTVTEIDSDNYESSGAEPGTIGSTVINNNSISVTVGPGQDSEENNFLDSPLAIIGGGVFDDSDRDGVQDEGEAPVPNVIVNLYNEDRELIGTTTTDAQGNYSFGNLKPGTYFLEFFPPIDYVITNVDSVNPFTGLTEVTTIGSGEVDLTWDAAVVFAPDEATNPKPVELESFTATQDGNGIFVQWITSAEVDTAGFHIYVSSDDSFENAEQLTPDNSQKMTASLIPGKGTDGGTYGTVIPYNPQTDPAITEMVFWLVELEINDKLHLYGPADIVSSSSGSERNRTIFLPLVTN